MIKLLFKQSSQFNSHLGHFLTWRDPWMPRLASPPGIHLPLALNQAVSSHYRYNQMSDFEFFSKDPSQWGDTYASIWGCLDICPPLDKFHLASITYPELSSLTSLRAWGDAEKFHSDMAYLLISAEDEAMSGRVYGLSTMWVNPFQARVSTVEEAVRQLTILGLQWTLLALCLGAAQ